MLLTQRKVKFPFMIVISSIIGRVKTKVELLFYFHRLKVFMIGYFKIHKVVKLDFGSYLNHH